MTFVELLGRSALISIFLSVFAISSFANDDYESGDVKCEITIEVPRFRPFNIHLGWADNRFSSNFNNLPFNNLPFLEDGGAAKEISKDSGDFSAKLRKNFPNNLEFKGSNADPDPNHPNPWRFDVTLQQDVGGGWKNYRSFSAQSKGYPDDSPNPGLRYDLMLHFVVVSSDSNSSSEPMVKPLNLHGATSSQEAEAKSLCNELFN